MNNIYLGLITLAVLVVAGYVVSIIIETKGLIRRATAFLESIEGNLKGTLEETEKSLKSTRILIDNVEGMTEDVKVLTSSARDVGENIRAANSILSLVTSLPMTQASALRAGVRAGVEYLVRNVAAKRKNT